MIRPSINKNPTFFWQALLIVLPVVVLAIVGAFSLRQDKILARHEATERAQVIADDLVPKMWNELTGANGTGQLQSLRFQTDAAGDLIFPPPYDSVPRPPNSTELPADNPKGIATYDAALLLVRSGKLQEAADAFETVVEKYPSAIGETGLELSPLAQWQLLELKRPATNRIQAGQLVTLESFCSNVVYHPTLLTPYFLQLASKHQNAASDNWLRLWEEHEWLRVLFSAACQRFKGNAENSLLSVAKVGSSDVVPPRMFWSETPDVSASDSMNRAALVFGFVAGNNHWLATRFDEQATNYWFVCRAESKIASQITAVVNAGQIPEFLGVGIEIAGRKLTYNAPDLRVWHEVNYFGRRGGGVKKAYLSELASTVLASATRLDEGKEQLKVNIYLTSPTELFKRQRTRTFWFGSLIGVSALAVLVGLLTAWRAFNRQQQLSEMKSNFVSSVSHELRAPIASVRLMAESLERGKISDTLKQSEYFRFIVQECRRLTSLIENVLDFSRIEQGRKQYEFEMTDLVALMRETVKLMEPYAAERGVRLETLNTQHSTFNFELTVDGRAMQQALVNLIDNAIKHSPKGETVAVGLAVGRQGSAAEMLDATRNPQLGTDKLSLNSQPSTINLSVEDHGEGMPPEEHEKIFERFYRLGSELRRETQGVGIGLSIVKHIVEAHGGKVQVRSAVGQGSRFTIEIPTRNETSNIKH